MKRKEEGINKGQRRAVILKKRKEGASRRSSQQGACNLPQVGCDWTGDEICRRPGWNVRGMEMRASPYLLVIVPVVITASCQHT